MRLELPTAGLQHYKSASQRARVASEAWAERNLFCPNCDSPTLEPAEANAPAIDYLCPQCNDPFQLKSQSRPLASRIVDAAYRSMRLAIEEDRTPNLLALHYERDFWRVRNLILIPRFAIPLSALERRNPLGPQARRAGWVGCNIVLTHIPPDARIPIVAGGHAFSAAQVRERYARLRPLRKLRHEQRGWTLDVLNAVRSLRRTNFSLKEAYALEGHLSRLHPRNRYVRHKIRQQLQFLRDLGLLIFLGGGNYRLL